MERKLKNSELTVKRIHQAMILLLNEKEFEKISVVDITKRVGINRTTFYLFYSSKEELLFDICSSFLEGYIEKFIQSLKYDEEVDIAIYKKAFTELAEYEKMLKAVWNVHTPDFDPYTIMQLSVEKAVKDFLVKNELKIKYGGTAELFASLYAANVMATVKWWIYNYEDHDVSLVKNLIDDCSNKGILYLLEK